MTETFYDRLGVADDATTEEIETAYREAIKRVHPDVSDDVDAGERTKRLNEAKRVLTDEDERARYDRLGHETYTGDGPTRSGSNAGNRADRTDSDRRTDAGPNAGESGSNAGGSAGGWSQSAAGGRGWRSGETDRSSEESTWRGSQQRGRRSGRRRKSHRGGRRPGGGFDVGPAGDEGGGANADDASDADTGSAGPSGSGRHRSSESGRNWSSESGRHRSPGDGTTRSRGDSTGPTWQSNGSTASRGTGGGATDGSPSAQRQAAAGSTDGPNVDWSWNAWESTGAWAVRQGSNGRRLSPSRLFPTGQSFVMLGSIFFLYPFFVASALYPRFPLPARLAIAVCTLLTFAYLLSIPEAAIAVFGLWSLLIPLVLLGLPGVSLFSIFGVVGLVATWVPLGLSVLTYSLVRP
ncbi:J domain-containing protein [Halosimplex sp. TS25]|uniref:J domain-containing protein n=1 Tax=Halosimplex rarum TaxID=3396619 RepID=UPI0039E812E8